VFVHGGELHIVPPDADGALRPPTLEEALRRVADPAGGTRAPAAVQAVLQARLTGFPARAREHLHRARCYVPRGVARLLVSSPGLVAAAVNSVLYRDARTLQVHARMCAISWLCRPWWLKALWSGPPEQACARMERFPVATGVVGTTVTFTRLQYAQLRALRLFPPKPFRLPPTTDPAYPAYDLGMKLVWLGGAPLGGGGGGLRRLIRVHAGGTGLWLRDAACGGARAARGRGGCRGRRGPARGGSGAVGAVGGVQGASGPSRLLWRGAARVAAVPAAGGEGTTTAARSARLRRPR
jgi:hypothetical protein